MFRYFAEQAEGAAYDSSIPPEVVRCYTLEALQLAKPIDENTIDIGRLSDRWITTSKDPIIEQTWTLLVSTYFDSQISPQDLIKGKPGIWLSGALEKLQKQQVSWTKFISD